MNFFSHLTHNYIAPPYVCFFDSIFEKVKCQLLFVLASSVVVIKELYLCAGMAHGWKIWVGKYTPPHFSPSLTYCAVVAAAAAAALVDIIEQVRRNISGRLGFVKKCALNVKKNFSFSMAMIALKLLVPTKFEIVPLVLLNSDN